MSRHLTDAEIDRYFAEAAAVIREVREATQRCFELPARLRRETLCARGAIVRLR